MMLRREIPVEFFEYVEVEDEAGNPQVIRRRLEHELIDGVKRIKRCEEEHFGYEERQDANGGRELVRVPLHFEIVDMECDDGEIHKVRKVVYPPRTEAVSEHGGFVERPIEFDIVKRRIDGRIHRVRRQRRRDLFFLDEIKNEMTGETKLVRKRRKFEVVQIDERPVRREVFEPEFEYDEGSDKEITKKAKVFVYHDEEGNRIRRQLRDDEYEYEDDNGEIVERRRRLHRFASIGGRQVRQEVIPPEFEYDYETDEKLPVTFEYRTVESEDKKRRLRTRIYPEEDFEYIFEERDGEEPTIIKRLKEFERFQDPTTKRVYRKEVVDLEWIQTENSDGTIDYKQVPKQFYMIEMLKDGKKVMVKQPIEYEMIEATLPDGTTIFVRGHRKKGFRHKKVIRTFLHQWPVENGEVVRPPSRRRGFANHIVWDWFTPVLETPSGVSEELALRVHQRGNLQKLDGEDQFEYDDPLDSFERDEDECYRPLGDNRAFARLLLADAMRRKIQRTELELAISDLQFEIGNVHAERRSIEHHIRLADLERRNRMKKCHADRVLDLSVEPYIIGPEYAHAGGQTRIVADFFDDLERQIAANERVIQQDAALHVRVAGLEKHYALLRQRIEANVTVIDQLTEIGDQLDRRFRLVRPHEGEVVLHPSVQRRLQMEQAFVDEKNEIVTIQTQTKECSNEIRKLKCRIEDLKCLHDMLHKKIAEARRVTRPNVPLMCKNLDGLKKQARVGAETVRMLTIEDSCLKELLAHRRGACGEDELLKLSAAIETLRERVKVLKQNAQRRWTLTEDGQPKRLALLTRGQIEGLERLSSQLDASLREAEDERFAVNSQIARSQRALVAKKMDVPEGFLQRLFVT
jgi:hypothetical protein